MTCGIHVTDTRPCVHCARAARQTADALADVVPTPPGKRSASKRSSSTTEEIVRELRSQGLSFAKISARTGVSTTTAAAIANGRRYDHKPRAHSQSDAQRRAHQRSMPGNGERAHRRANVA
jgi:hypothetical protein